MSWGATGTQRTRSSVQWIHTDKIWFLHAKHSLRKPPHASGSHKIIKSAIVQQCCRRSKCCDLMWLYAGQSKTKCCSSSTQSNDLHTRHSLSVLSRWTPSAQRPVSTRRSWHPVLNLLISLLFDAHLTTDRYSADLYSWSGCIVLYNIKLLCWTSAKYWNACWCLALSMTDAMSKLWKSCCCLKWPCRKSPR